MNIRLAHISDCDTIVSNNLAMAKETEGKSLDIRTVTAGVREVIEQSHRGFYLLAELEGRIIGQLMVTFEWSDWRDGHFWWIQSVYVAARSRRQGVFSALYRHLEQDAVKSEKVCGLRLYADKDNQVAQAVYRKLGMNLSRYRMYEIDWVLPDRAGAKES